MTAIQHWSEWPVRDKALDPDGYVYVLEFSMGVVKVGRTNNPRGRVRQHQSDASRFGGHITRHWLSPSHRGYHASEATLIAAATEAGVLVGGAEYFADCSFDDLTAVGRGLSAAPSTVEQRAERERRAQAAVDRFRDAFLPPPQLGYSVHVESETVASLVTVLLGSEELPRPAAPSSTADLLEAAGVWAETAGLTVDQVLDMCYIDAFQEALVKLVRLSGDLLRTKARVAERWDLLASGHEQIANNARLSQIALPADEAAAQLTTAGAA